MKIHAVEFIRKLSWFGWAFVAILFVGIFLRTYNFHDWLRFNADQSRDATVVSGFIEGTSTLPLLGPKAGGTNFRLGPIFYYFQIGAAELFGNAPDTMAYPDLLFSILAIPLLFLFLRKYFDRKTALLLTALFSVSFYAVKYSRFAWNPNSLPLWSILFLYALHEIAIAPENVKKRWIIFAGLAVGVGVQLHTLALILFPTVTLLMFGFLFYKKKLVWKALLAIVCIAAFLNTGQIVSEVNTHGENVSAFFKGVGTKQKKEIGFVGNVAKDVVCFAEGNAYIVSSYDSSDTCEVKSVTKGYAPLIFLFSLVFFLGGVVLAARAFRREVDVSKKYFLGIFLVYFGLSFFVLIPFANEISMRFFLIVVFMPFVFLGLWFEYLSEKFPRGGVLVAGAITGALVLFNLTAVQQSFIAYTSYIKGSEAGMDNVMLREVESAARYITLHSDGAQSVSLEGDAKYLFKALKSIQYFTERENIHVVQKGRKVDKNMPAFLVDNSKQKDKIMESGIATDSETIGRFTIFSLKKIVP